MGDLGMDQDELEEASAMGLTRLEYRYYEILVSSLTNFPAERRREIVEEALLYVEEWDDSLREEMNKNRAVDAARAKLKVVSINDVTVSDVEE